MVRKYYYNFRYQKISKHKVTWIWPCIILYCLIYGRILVNKFNKQQSTVIANSLAKIINDYKGKFKAMSSIWDGAFSAICYWLQRRIQNFAKNGAKDGYKDGIFCRNSQKLKTIHYFRKIHHLGCLTRLWLIFWIGF